MKTVTLKHLNNLSEKNCKGFIDSFYIKSPSKIHTV